MLETITVNSLSDGVPVDDSTVTLREAILSANSNTSVGGATAGSSTEVDIININASGFGRHELSLGELDITESVIINGNTDHPIDGNGQRIFDVGSGNVDVTLNNLILTGGKTIAGEHGGAVRFQSSGDLTVNDSDFRNNTAARFGGGIHVDTGADKVVINNSTFIRNTAGEHGGGLLVNGATETTITNSRFDDNEAQESSGGFFVYGDELSVVNSTISNNRAIGTSTSYAGGLQARAVATITGSTISRNQSSVRAGGIEVARFTDIINSTIVNNHSNAGVGGINAQQRTRIVNSTISGNTSDTGVG